jgi:hypothetical protein
MSCKSEKASDLFQTCNAYRGKAVKFIVKKSKCAGLAQEISFSTPNSCSLPWLVKGTTQLHTSQKECNKLHLTAAQYF